MPSQVGKIAERALRALFSEEYPFPDLNMYIRIIKDDRAFSILHQKLPQILVLCFP